MAGKFDHLLNPITSISENATPSSSKKLIAPQLSDEEVLALVERFDALPEEQKQQLLLGRGTAKEAFQIPDSEYILKKNRYKGDIGEVFKDYVTHKQAAKHLPVEMPILVTRPNKDPVLLQKKLQTLVHAKSAVGGETPSEIKEKLIKGSEDLANKAWNNEFLSHVDIYPDNVGMDTDGKIKVIDVGPFEGRWATDKFYKNEKGYSKNDLLHKARAAAAEKLSGKNFLNPKIYRSIPLIGPAIGAGIAAMSGDANAASGLPVLGEAESLGPEQGSEDWEIENPQASPAARRAALQKLLNK